MYISIYVADQVKIYIVQYKEMLLLVFCLIYTLQTQDNLISFRETSGSENISICKHVL